MNRREFLRVGGGIASLSVLPAGCISPSKQDITEGRMLSDGIRIEVLGPIELMGVSVYGHPKADPTGDAWSLFGQVSDEAGISRVGKDIYGVRIYPPKFPAKLDMSYMACLKKNPKTSLPLRMVSKTLPKCRYIVKRAKGVTGIDKVIRELYQYIADNNLKVGMPFDFEKYCNVTDHEKVPDVIEVWIPIKDA